MKVHATYGRLRVISSGVGTYHVQVKPMDMQMDWVSIETFDYLMNARKMAVTLWREWVEASITHTP